MYTYLVYVEKPGFIEIYVVPTEFYDSSFAIEVLRKKYIDLQDISLDKFSCVEVITPLYITSHRTQEG